MIFQKKRYFIGDSCLCWSLGDMIDIEISSLVLSLYQRLSEKSVQEELKIRDLVPSYNALAIHFDPDTVCLEILIREVEGLLDQEISSHKKAGLQGRSQGVIHQIPVVYDGVDIPRVADLNRLTSFEVIQLHQKPDYTIAMIGFLPHYPYLIGLDQRLATPRLDSPRTKVPGGSVAIGGAQAGIYPQESPGGWNIIGRTNPFLLLAMKPGDLVRFSEVDHL